jgi:hypothetical protein
MLKMYTKYTIKDLITKLSKYPEDAVIKIPIGRDWELADPNKISYEEFRGDKTCYLEFK